MKRLLAPLLATILIFTIPPAHAALDKEGAVRVKQIFTRYLEQRQTASRLAGQDLKMEGDIMVEPGDNYYAVTMPHISVHNPDGSYTDIGILAINAMPGGKQGEWRMTIAIPTPVIGYDAQKKIQSRIDIGAQTLAGVWNEQASHFTKLDARYENVTIQRIQDGMTIKIPKTSVIFDLTPAADGKMWSGPAKYRLENLEITRSGDPGISRIGRLDIDAFLHDYSPESAKTYQEKLAALAESAGDGPVSEKHVMGMYNMVFDSFSSIWDGFDSSIIASDIALARPAVSGSPESTFKIAKAGLALNAKGFRSNTVGLTSKVFYEGFSLTPAPQALVDATPTHFNLDLSLSKVPFRDLVALGKTSLQSSGVSEKTPAETAALMTMALQIMTNAGTSLDIRDTTLGNTFYNAMLNGKILADLNAAMKAAGKVTLNITGLDQIMAMTKKQSGDKTLDDATRKKLQDLVVSMTILQAMGQKAKDATGKEIRTYDLELTKEGQLTLNGTDLSAIQAMIGAAKGKSSPPAPAQPVAPKP